MFGTEVGELWWHDCDQDPGPILSPVTAVEMAAATLGCDPRRCKTRQRVAEVVTVLGIEDPRPARQCVDGAYSTHTRWIDAGVDSLPLIEVPIMFCRIDPGPVTPTLGRMLTAVHHGCGQSCRVKLRGRQAITATTPSPIPDCPVPEERIATAVARLIASHATLRAATIAARAGQPYSDAALSAALSEFTRARRYRDALFLLALPQDGTIPTTMINRFGLSIRELRRIVPGLNTPTPRTYEP